MKNFVGRESTPYINYGKGDTLARRAMSLLLQGERRTSEDLEGGKPPPAPDQGFENNSFAQLKEQIWL